MGIKERLFEHPGAFFAGCFVWIFLAIWIYSLVVWAIQGDLEFPIAVVGCGIALALGYLTMNPPRPEFAPWIAIATAAPVLSYPFLSNASRKRALVQIDVEEVERAYDALGQQPQNPALKFRLAKALFNRGMVHAALAIAEPALKELPRRHYMDENRMIVGWRSHAVGKPPASYGCLQCGFHNRPGTVFCQGCGGRLFLPHAEGRWVGKATMQKVLVVWFSLMLLVFGIPAATMALQPVAALVVIVLMLGLAAFGGVTVFRHAEHPA
ncbi:MAG: hypothetical protein ACYC96_07265 [Fimbriimonadaceae bacterium]